MPKQIVKNIINNFKFEKIREYIWGSETARIFNIKTTEEFDHFVCNKFYSTCSSDISVKINGVYHPVILETFWYENFSPYDMDGRGFCEIYIDKVSPENFLFRFGVYET